MKTLFIWTTIMATLCSGCKTKYDVHEDPAAEKTVSCMEFSYPLNGDSLTTFGFEALSDVDIISPRAISIDQNQCFIIDPLYNRLKRISLHDGKMESSRKLPDSLGRINDCIIIGGQVVATSTNGAVIIFDEKLTPVFMRKVSRGNGTIISRSGSEFVAYFPSDDLKTFSINMNGEIGEVRQGRQNLKNRIHGKPFQVSSDTIFTDKYKYPVQSIKYVPNKYGGINLDYVENGIAFFVLEDTRLKLNFCTMN